MFVGCCSEKRVRFILLILTVIWLVASSTFADTGPRAVSEIQAGLLPVERVSLWQSPAVDVAALRVEDAAHRDVPGVPLRIGFPMDTDLTPANSGTWEELPGGDSLWRLRVRTEGALWTVLGFDVFRLQVGAELWVYDPSLATAMGPYTSRNIRSHGELWFPPIAGDELIVEVYWPASLSGESPDLHLGKVSHGYKPFGIIGREATTDDDFRTDGFGDSGSCNIDVACPLGDDWRDQIRGAVILLSGGSSFCSGSLINTTADDCRPYVLTADHCHAGASTSFGFNFERPECGAGTPLPPTNQTVTGATLLAEYTSSDMTLLEMDSAPPEEFNVYYSGWSRDTAASQECWGIHHPSGDAKKISHNSDPLVDGTNYGPTHWRITEWEEGTTEGGSSGSPLFDNNHRIVGQLHGGQASCTNITWDEYGKLDVSWTGGGTVGTRLSDWLDPEATGAVVMDGVDWATCATQLAGSVRLSADTFPCSDVVQVTLRDDHLTGQSSHDVTIQSTTETTPEVVSLTAIAPDAGRFVGTIAIEAVAAVNGDGLLSVGHDDTITVEYIDADDGMGGSNVVAQAIAAVDCQSPVISNVMATDVTGSAAVITWDTDEPADSSVMHGLSPGGGTTVNDSALVTQHDLRLQGLPECSVHYYAVESTDSVGNGAIDDAEGAWYSFETGRNVRPEYLNETQVSIPDNIGTGVATATDVPDDKTVLDVDVIVNVTHTFTGDLTLQLEAPSGQTVVLSNRRGSSGANFTGTHFDDEALTPIASGTAPFTGSYQPDEPLSVIDGINAMGTWQLRAIDGASSDTGTLDSWTLILTYPGEACGPHAAVVEHLPLEDTCAAGGAGNGDGLWDPGETVRFGVTLKNDGIGALTGLTARVTAATPGVVMIDDTASFADLAPGATGTSIDPHFSALLPESVVCGAELAFTVDVTSNEGSWNEPFAQLIGGVLPGGGIVLAEDFSAGIPGDWTVVDGSNDGHTWFADDASDPLGCDNPDPTPPMQDGWAAVDSDCAGSVIMDEELITPLIDLSAAWSAAVEFDHYFDRYGTEFGDVDVRSSLTGGAWINVARYDADRPDPTHETYDLTAWAAGANDVQLRFRYHGANFEWYWFVDNVAVSYTGTGSCATHVCPATPGAPWPVPGLAIQRVDAAGDRLQLSWDDRCGPVTAKVIYGPLEQVASLTPAGHVCAIANPHFLDPAPAGDLWFLVIGEDGAGVESSWGASSYGERNGLSASGTCGSAAKDITAVCP